MKMLDSAERRYWAFAVAPALLFFLVYMIIPLDSRPTANDSRGYLEFWRFRNGGYPAFLDLAQWLGLSIDAICRAQLTIYLFASLFLVREIFKTTGTVAPAAIMSLLLWAALPSAIYHYRIMTESLLMSLQLVALVFLLRSLDDFRPKNFGWVAVCLGAMFALRKTAIATLPLALILLVIAWPALKGKRARTIGFMAVGLIATIGAEQIYYSVNHSGLPRQSILGVHLFAKSAVIDVDHEWREEELAELIPEQRDFLTSLDSEAVNYARQIAWSGDDPVVKNHFRGRFEMFMQHGYRGGERAALYEAGICEMEKCAGMLLTPALMRLSKAPGAYLDLTYRNLIDLWSGRTGWATTSKADLKRIAAEVSKIDDYPFAREYDKLAHPRKTHPAVPVLKLGFQAAGIVLLAAAIWGFVVFCRGRERPRYLMMATICALGVHGTALFAVMFGHADRRYIVGMWPFMAGAAFFFGLYLWSLYGPRLKRYRRASMAT